MVCGALALVHFDGRAQVAQKSILLVYSGESGQSAGGYVSPAALVDLALERIVRTRLGGNLLYYSEHVDTTRLGDPSYVQDVRSLLQSKYADRKLDLIFVFGDVAVEFTSKHRATFFPETPVVFGRADPHGAMPNSTGIVGPISQRKVLETALQVKPDTRHVAIVAGTTAYDQYYVKAAREEFKPYEGRLTFTYLTGLPMRELLSRVTTLPPQSIILFMGVTRDGEGRLFLPQEVLESVSTVANAPTFGWNGVGIGHGLVGGTVYSQEVEASYLAAVGLRVLNGERAETIPVTEVDWSTTQFDWRQLRRWNISESRLPQNSTVLFRQPSAWELYRKYILGGALILILQTALIAGLVMQGARRRRMELALRESERHFRTMADTAPVFIWRSGIDKGCDFFNKPWLDFRGRTLEQEQGSGWTDGVHPDDRASCVQTYITAFESREPFSMEYRVQRADGAYRWLMDIGVPRYDDTGHFVGFIGSAIDITDRKQIEQQNQDLAGRLIGAQEEERTRIARDLHDDLSQQLAGMSIMLSALKRMVGKPASEPDIGRAVTTLEERASALVRAVRNISHELHPSVLEQAGLAETLQRHCAEVQEHHHLAVTFSAGDELDSVSPEVAICLFRVAQEAITNAVRHARARTIRVQLKATNEEVELRVDDDGIGFVASERFGGGLGLRSIDERVRLNRGHVSVESRPGRGTSLVARIPRPVPTALGRVS
jgi:PAS domain S-box-containing protein